MATDRKGFLLRLIGMIGEDVLRDLNPTDDELGRLFQRGTDLKEELTEAIRPIIQSYSTLVSVPDILAVELTAMTKKELRLIVDPTYQEWDYYHGTDGSVIEGRGLSFERLVVPMRRIEPSARVVPPERILAYCKDLGYFGHTGAFTQWRRQNPTLTGCHASIPEDSACRRDSGGKPNVACSLFNEKGRTLKRLPFDYPWTADWSFVAFRLVS